MINIIPAVIGTSLSIIAGGLVKGFFWVRSMLAGVEEIRTNHLPHVQAAVEAIPLALEAQTEVLVAGLSRWERELSEQRQDIRDLRTDLVTKL